ncbi:MAG TPA: hypothetical protein PKC28_06575, partial [Bdellovibrionales bacterium]|nr:hypothetical protein [Bdellovibrionales bacterium]
MKKIVLFIFTTALLLIVSGPTHAYIGDAYYKPGWDIVKWDNSWRWDNELPFENPFYNRDLIYYNYDTEEQRLVLKANQEVVLKNAIHTESQGKTLRSSKNSRCWINLKQERNWLQKPGSSDKLSPYDPHGTPLI